MYKAALILLNYQTTKIINVRQEGKQDGDQNAFIWSSAELDTSYLVAKNSRRILKEFF